jgi:ABC-type multidrug transport system permease subunit
MTFWTIAINDLKLTFRDKMFFFWLLVFPLLFAVIFGTAFPESSGAVSKVALNVQDNDQSILSQALIEELKDENYAVEEIEKKEEKKVRALIIPKGFSQNILAGEKTDLILEKEADSNMEASQAAYANVLKAIIKILTKVVIISPNNEAELAQQYSQEDIQRLISLKTELGGELESIPASYNHSIPAVAVAFIIFTILMYGGIILLQERRQGQLERIFLSPATFSTIIAGKWISRVILGMIQVTLLFMVGRILFKVYWGESILSIFLLFLFFCGTMAGMSILFGSLIRKEEIIILLNILVANLMASLGGCWWPLELVPSGIRKIGFAFPTGWAMDGLHKLIFFGHDFNSVLPHVGVLFLFTVVFLALAVKFFKLRKA